MMLMLHWNAPYSGLHHINYYMILANKILQLVVICGECLTDCQDCLKSNPRCYTVSTERVRHINYPNDISAKKLILAKTSRGQGQAHC